MVKANVNTASREELVEAGVRTELADEILKLRRKGKITSLEAIEAVQGVGPGTLEQLRKLLDFSDRSGNGGGRDVPKVQEDERRRSEDVGARPVDTTSAAVRGGAALAQDVQQSGVKVAGEAARSGLLMARRAAGAAGSVQRELAQGSADMTAELGQALVALMQQQTQHNVETLAALSDAVDWTRLCQIQADFVRTSLERMAGLARRQLELGQGMMAAILEVTQERDRKAA